jgi:type 1 fimbria pilin
MDIGEMVVVLETNGRVSQGGVVPGGLLARWSLSDGKTLLDINIAPFTVNVLGCTVTTPTLSVPLGAVNRARFRGLGSTAGGSKFSIGMTCDSAISPTVTFSGTPDNDASNILALNSISDGTAASGVGIQLLYKDNPVLLNSAISLGKTTSAGGLNMDFNARYYQTTPSITAGEANSTASFTINYE